MQARSARRPVTVADTDRRLLKAESRGHKWG